MSTICLNMIVKNEAPVIGRCLASVLPFVDRWVIVDTGSTDGTQVVTDAAAAVGFQAEQILAVLRHRDDAKWPAEPRVFEDYLEAVERTARFVDQLHPGDH